MAVCEVAARYFKVPLDQLDGSSRIDDYLSNEFDVIEFTTAVEAKLGCDIPDLEITMIATLAQLATMAEQYRVLT
jgi:acyl carrier protein